MHYIGIVAHYIAIVSHNNGIVSNHIGKVTVNNGGVAVYNGIVKSWGAAIGLMFCRPKYTPLYLKAVGNSANAVVASYWSNNRTV